MYLRKAEQVKWQRKENLQEKDKPQQVQPPLDKMHYKLFDASYHNYRMIDRDRADTTEYQKSNLLLITSMTY